MHSPSRSREYDAESDSWDGSGRHKWDAFEIRTLVCLIIKEEHRLSPDPMDFATKMNSALNPGKANTKNAAALFARDIPVDDVSDMLQRILSKKKHAVNLSDRHRTRIVTRSKVNAFMRSLDFEGSEAEWAVLGKKEEVNLERMGMRMKLDEEKNESQSQREEKEKRLDRMSPRELRLLAGWGIGPTFWDDVIEDNRPQSRGRSRTRRRSPASDDDYIPTIPDKISSAHASIPPKAQDSNAFAVPAIPRSGVSAGRPLAAGTPAWNTPGAPLFMVPLTPDVTDMGGWGGSFDPTAPTPLAGGCGSAYGGVYSAADLDVRQQPSSYSGWGGAFDTSPQLPVPTPVCGANGGRGYGNASPESLPRETSGQKVDVDKSKQTSGYMSNGHWQ